MNILKTKLFRNTAALVTAFSLTVVCCLDLWDLRAMAAGEPNKSGNCGTNAKYSFDEASGTLTISGSGDMTGYGSVDDAPWKAYRSQIRNINIGEEITLIGQYAFAQCNFLESITIPEGVNNIGFGAFYECSKLQSVTFAENSKIESIPDLCFQSCSSLESITIPSKVTSLGKVAFRFCTALQTVTLPEDSQLETIGNNCFEGCSRLERASIYAKKVGDYAFKDCNGLQHIHIENTTNDLEWGTGAFSGCDHLDDITFDSGVKITKIPSECFKGDRRITGFTGEGFLTSGVTEIESEAFSGCNLKDFIIPDTVNTIGENAFYGCGNIFYSNTGKGNFTETYGADAMIKYTVEGNNAKLEITAAKDNECTINLPAEIDGKTIVSANYTDYRGRITHDGEHNYNADKICQICGEEDPGLAINETNFPDENFREYVKEKFDKDSNNYLSDEEIGKITGIFVAGKGITTLKGIEHFNRVTYIDAKNNNITDELDLSGCPILSTLYVENNSGLTSIKFGDVSKLGDLTCKNTGITELDLSGASNLTSLDCRNNDYKGVLESLNLSGAVKLRQLYCLGNKLTELDLGNCGNLTYLHCERNQLTSLTLPAMAENLVELNCSDNRQLTALDLGRYDSLKTLHCGTTAVTALDLTGLPNLEKLYCYSSKLTSLDASPCKKLSYLSCSVNFPMTELNVSQNTQLKTLQCGNTALTSLDLILIID